jgi:hypothetical protein
VIVKEIAGRPTALSFLRPEAIRDLAADPSFSG